MVQGQLITLHPVRKQKGHGEERAAMLYYAMLCYAMLCYAMLCYAWVTFTFVYSLHKGVVYI